MRAPATHFRTIAGPSEGIYKEKGSKFLAYAYPVRTREEVQSRLTQVKKEHPKARHHCFAWRLGYTGDLFRAADDGEPSGTAGKPILGQIDKNELTDIVIIVVRYFGGTLLGTSGLIRAYREASADALAKAQVEEHPLLDTYRIQFGYDLMSQVIGTLKNLNLPLFHQAFDNNGVIEFGVPVTEPDKTLLQLKAGIGGISLSQASSEDWPEGIKVELIKPALATPK